MNCFHCWFVFLIKIKLEKIYKYRNNLVYFASLLSDFFSLINKFKHIYIQPDYTNIEFYDLKFESFGYYLGKWDSCLCCCSESGPL